MEKNQNFTSAQLWLLVILRVAIGWHLLYEGVIKLLNPNWSSVGYLMDSSGIFTKMFHSMASNPGLLKVVDFLNVWGLILVGLGLVIGMFTRAALYGGIVLLTFYFLSHPPLINATYAVPSEGSYMLINKNLIEALSMGVLLLFPTWKVIGIDRFIIKGRGTN